MRSNVTAEPINAEYRAGHEVVSANIEQLFFDNMPSVRANKPGSIAIDDAMAARLNGSDPNKRIGTAIMLKTMPGDRFNISVDAFYEGEHIQSDDVSTEDVISSLLGTLTNGANYAGVPIRELPDNMRTVTLALGNPQLAGQLDYLLNSNNNVNAPKAHLNYLFFDDKMELVASHSGSVQVPSNSTGISGWTNVSPLGGGTTGMTFEEGVVSPGVGWMLVYIDNQSIGKDVWFDNLMIGMYKGIVTGQDHYYPFGLTLAVSEDQNVTKNPLKLTTKELEKSFGLEMYDFGARMYDPAGPHWLQVDPLAEKRLSLTPYNYCSNNPISRIDPSGMTDFTLNKETGEVKQIGEANDTPDRILKTNGKGEVKYNRKGDAKVAVGNIEQGILKDGMNFKDNSNLFAVGGKDQPSLKGVESFALKLSTYVNREIGGSYFSKDGADDVTHITFGAYKNNNSTTTTSYGHNMFKGEEYYKYKQTAFFHTHPTFNNPNYSAHDRFNPSKADVDFRDNNLKINPNLKHYIITEPDNSDEYNRVSY